MQCQARRGNFRPSEMVLKFSRSLKESPKSTEEGIYGCVGAWCLMSSPLEMLSGWLSALFKDFQTCTCCLSTRVVFSAGFFIIYLFLGPRGLDLVLGEAKLRDGSDPWWDGAVGISTRREEIGNLHSQVLWIPNSLAFHLLCRLRRHPWSPFCSWKGMCKKLISCPLGDLHFSKTALSSSLSGAQGSGKPGVPSNLVPLLPRRAGNYFGWSQSTS